MKEFLFKMDSIYIFGHKNPDTDSIVSAMSLAHLKNKLGISAKPYRLGKVSKETKFVLSYFSLETPPLLNNVKTTILDMPFEKIAGARLDTSILEAIWQMEENGVNALAVINKSKHLIGMLELDNMALKLLKNFDKSIKTSTANIIHGLDARLLTSDQYIDQVDGQLIILSYYFDTIVSNNTLEKDHIVIVGDRYDIIEHAIRKKVALIVIPGKNPFIPSRLIEMAEANQVTIIVSNYDSYETAKRIPLCQPIASFVKKDDVFTFYLNDYLAKVLERTKKASHQRFFPVLDASNDTYLGLFTRRNLLSVKGKQVILVDHNEYSQSAEGLKEANILEIYDHHKLGDIKTNSPIFFKNLPVGSSSTIVYNEFKKYDLMPDPKYCGALLSGIISDTLLLNSPTTTQDDVQALASLSKHLDINVDIFSKELFRAGTKLGNESSESLFHKDCKWFEDEGEKIVVSQLFTFEISALEKRLFELEQYMNSLAPVQSNTSAFLLVTDILEKGSFLYYSQSAQKIIDHCFDPSFKPGTFLPNVVSRKKQIMPLLMDGLQKSYRGE